MATPSHPPTPAQPVSPRRQRIGLLWTAGGALCAAVYLIPYEEATRRTSVALVALPMLLVAALLNSALLLPGVFGSQRKRGEGGSLGLTWLVAALLGVFSALGNEAVARALGHNDPGVTAVLGRTQVVFVVLGAMVLLGERVSGRFWLGIGVALLGMTLLRLGGGAVTVTLAGMLWALLAAASFGAMQVTVRRTISRIDVVLVNTLRLWLSVAFIALLPGRVAGLFGLEPLLWALTATSALSGPVLSRLLLMVGLRHIPASLSSLAMFAQPVFAYILSALVFDSRPALTELAGCAVVLAGVALPLIRFGPNHLKL